MKTKSFLIGLTMSCLILLSGCAKDQPLPALQIIKTGCPAVTACTLTATNPDNNGNLLSDIEAVEADWAMCAGKVDLIIEYNEQHKNEQAK